MTLTDHLQPMLEKKPSAALVAAFLLQLAGALFWVGAASQRLDVVERALAADQVAINRVAVLEEQVTQMNATLTRIEEKLDRADTPTGVKDQN
jgi:hypothetical protein